MRRNLLSDDASGSPQLRIVDGTSSHPVVKWVGGGPWSYPQLEPSGEIDACVAES